MESNHHLVFVKDMRKGNLIQDQISKIITRWSYDNE